MFLFRSAFWLTVGFLVVAPHGTDFGAAASAVRDQAIAAGLDAGQRLVVSQISSRTYSSSALLDVLNSPSVALPMQESTTAVVFPRSRPAAMG